jgi:hypothetical protein
VVALQGDIKDFSVVDILQLLYQQQKSGILTISEKDNQVEVLFDRGQIVSANLKKKSEHENLGEMLVKANLISRKQLINALEMQKETLRKLGDILIETGFISIIDLRHFLKLQTHETIFKLLSWKRGDYYFNQRLINYDKKAIEPINTEHFLMDSLRMTDELPDLRKRVYSYNLVFEKMPGADEEIGIWRVLEQAETVDEHAIFADEKKPHEGEKVITVEEKKVFHLVDGSKTVKDIINIGRLGEFETTKALVSLMEKQLIDISFEIEEKKEIQAPVSIQDVFFKGIFFGIFFILIVILFFSYPRIVSNFSISDDTREIFNKTQTMAIKDTITYPLSTFYLLNGRYPDDLDELSTSGLVESTRPGWESLFDYTPSPQGYTLKIR